jgi:sodium/proline symporter
MGKKLDNAQALRLARITIVVASLIAIFLARNPDSSVFKIVSFAWGGFGGAFSAVMLLSLFWKRVNRQGAVAGIISGGLMIFVWKFLIRPLGGGWDIYELLPAFIVSLVFCVVVSLLTPEPSAEINAEFDAAGN